MTSVKKEERREDRKFVALPPETVQLVAETSGLSNLQPTVAAALSEDASYRARELAHVRKHASRRRERALDTSTRILASMGHPNFFDINVPQFFLQF